MLNTANANHAYHSVCANKPACHSVTGKSASTPSPAMPSEIVL
ncbi:hypothetical protein [Kingella oralis]|nr:hypothetical protein [Kingella oralis]